ncbi:MAG: thioesterase family protein [Candidatus Rokubacteria bacterium]|nr:thioesterase family protein [Candidatus Rokubacteria bacterium]
MTSIPDAYFVADGGRFIATEHTRGPWSDRHQHGGPPSALLVRAIERVLAGSGTALARITIELLSPVPIATLEVAASATRAGRKVQRLDATLTSDGRLIARATALAIRTTALELPAPAGSLDVPAPADSDPFVFPFFRSGIGYALAVEARLARGVWGKGPATLWIRTRVPLVAGELPSPLQRVMIAADSGNGIAVVLDAARWTFVNADLTVALHRPPDGEWIGLDAGTTVEPSGVGLTVTRLLDTRGTIGIAHQSLVVDPRV